MNRAALTAQPTAIVETETIVQGVDAQPLVRRLLLAAADHLRGADLSEVAERLEGQAWMLRVHSPGETEAVEQTALQLAAKIALGGPKPEELAEILKLLAVRERRAGGPSSGY